MKYILPVKIFLISSSIAIVTFVYFFFSETGLLPNFKENDNIILWSIVAYNSIGVILHIINTWLNVALPYFSGISKRLFIGFFVNIISGSVIYLFFSWIYFLFHEGSLSGFLENHPDFSLKHIIIFILIILFYTLIDFTLFSFNYFTTGQVANEKQKREKLHLQFQALKNQLSPHFLFNSLNTISSLIYKDAKKAENYIRKLAHTYDYILKNLDKNLVSINEELLTVNAYKFLMEVRYHKAFSLDIQIPEKYLSFKLPPLSVQMLVENAIKHNVISDSEPLHVTISCDLNNHLVISNNTTSTPSSKTNNINSYKIGLENIRKRYSFFTTKLLKVENKENFVVKLPMLQPDTNEK